MCLEIDDEVGLDAHVLDEVHLLLDRHVLLVHAGVVVQDVA